MKHILPLWALILTLCIGSCNQYDAPTVTGSITGYVSPIDESAANLPRNGVKVTIEEAGKSTISDANGYWIVNDVPAGIYTISFSKDSFSTNKIIAYQFVGNGTAYTATTQLPKVPPYITTIDSVSYDTSGGKSVLISGTQSRPQTQNRTVLLFLSKNSTVSANPKEYSAVVLSFVSALSTSFAEAIPVSQLQALGFSSGNTVYVTSYATSKQYYRYIDLATGRNFYSGVMQSPTNTRSFVVP